ncbi:hypothetical protein CAPTEDRAFT_219049 [Capitella teleta]|uniref:CASP C-terminal domain-containing protein n=1 Tax=Capitella teleta TaxID=283909 RepID=R7TDW8_CAPTE|nr:hypothetical protein CAPTEDRAFT_219049 [Capitella teleta]|eukprot:ELT91707.1 hypothetical protein CAPTEDRAFT_219049 [Capitella teleta]
MDTILVLLVVWLTLSESLATMRHRVQLTNWDVGGSATKFSGFNLLSMRTNLDISWLLLSLDILIVPDESFNTSYYVWSHTTYNLFPVKSAKLQEQYNEAFITITDQKQLIAQLEEDLRNVNALSSMFRGEGEGEATSHSAEFVADAVKDVAIPPSHLGDAPPLKSAADSLLPIVQSQRERFRVRAQELEAESTLHQQQITFLQNEMDKLRSDNVKLYEKIKFLQSYPTKNTFSDDTENRYSSQYEEKLDPFSSFSKKERQRKYMNLKPYDKITLSMGRFVMGNKIARTIVFFYTILLHLLVFLVLYKMAYTESCKRDLALECQNKFADHMAAVHGEALHHDDVLG